MERNTKNKLTVTTLVEAPVEKVWKFWTTPEHITQWNNASDDWHSPSAANDLKPGGKFKYRMEAKDNSFGFDFEGSYDAVDKEQRIEYTIADGRKVEVLFEPHGEKTKVTEHFEPENQNPEDLQQGGWQAILDNFKKHTESSK